MSETTALPVGIAPAPWPYRSDGPSASDWSTTAFIAPRTPARSEPAGMKAGWTRASIWSPAPQRRATARSFSA